jgi:hypothetical protein
MVNLFLFGLGFIVLIAVFYDNVIFLDAQKKVLNQKFGTWWKTVENYNKLKLALVFAKKVNEILDSTFGPTHLSKKLVIRCSIISAGLLLVTLSLLGLTNRQPFWATPWKAYSESFSLILRTTEELASPSNYATFKVVNLVPIAPQINTTTNLMLFNVNSNYVLFTMTTNGIYEKNKIDSVGYGSLNIYYSRFFKLGNNTNQTTNSFSKVPSSTDLLEELVNGPPFLSS